MDMRADVQTLAQEGGWSMKSKKWLGQLLIGLVIVAAGVFILVRTESFLQIFVIILGLAAIINGSLALISMNRYAFGKYNRNATIVKGILGLVVGVLAVVLPLATAETTWMIFIYILAGQMLISAFITLVASASVRRQKLAATPMVQEALVNLVLAVILFLFPRSLGTLLINILGIIVIAVGATIGGLAFYAREKRDLEAVVEVEAEVVAEE